MTDNTELKRLAEACVAAGEYLPGEAWEEDRSYGPDEVAFLEFVVVATPAALLDLLNDIVALKAGGQLLVQDRKDALAERDQLKAANDRQRLDIEAWRLTVNAERTNSAAYRGELNRLKGPDFTEELAALRKDAERYRWLRLADWWRSPICVIRNPKEQAKLGTDCPTGERLDDAIDAAIGKGEQL